MRRGKADNLEAAARAFYAKAASTAPPIAMVGFNIFAVAANEAAAVEVWPENWPALNIFCQLQTQWNTSGMGGRTGLRYEALYPLLDRLDPDDWEPTFSDVRTMEAAALIQMSDDA